MLGELSLCQVSYCSAECLAPVGGKILGFVLIGWSKNTDKTGLLGSVPVLPGELLLCQVSYCSAR